MLPWPCRTPHRRTSQAAVAGTVQTRRWYGQKRFVVPLALVLVAAGAAFWFVRSSMGPGMEQDLKDRLGEDFFVDFDLDRYAPDTLTDSSFLPDSPYLSEAALARSHADAASVEQPDTPRSLPRPPLSPRTTGRPPSEAIILRRHEPKFRALERAAVEKLDILFATAREEYSSLNASGSLNRLALINRYMQAGRLLERNTDAVFHAMIADLRRDLQQHDYPTLAAGRIEADYLRLKNERRSRILGEIRSRGY
jgi:hypothetical protein